MTPREFQERYGLTDADIEMIRETIKIFNGVVVGVYDEGKTPHIRYVHKKRK